MRKPKEIRNIVVFSDSHIGCSLALMHPDGAETDNGPTVKPSAIQLKLWERWELFWNEWVPRVTHGEPYAVVHNGDAIDGVHHNSTTQWSHNLADQRNHAEKILSRVVELCEGRYYHIRGTEAHVGKSATEEEQLAKALNAIPSPEGHHARWELLKKIGDDTAHFSHHIGTTSSAHHETSAVNGELASAFTEAGRWGHAPPKIIVRSHRHRCSEIRLPARCGYATSFVTPAWQLKTPYVFKLPGGRNSAPQVGGSAIRVGDEEIYTRHCVWELARPVAE